MLITELIKSFEKLRQRNPTIVLTGSLALFLQNVRLPRLPEDIDIFLPFGNDFKMIDGMSERVINFYSNGNSLREDNRIRSAYDYHVNGGYIKIDVFQPILKTDSYESSIESNGIPCIHQREILKYKVDHALNGNEKHKTDMFFILNNSGTSYPKFVIQRPIIFFDVETTGVDKVNDRIVELTTIKYFNSNTFEIKTQRFNPTIPIPASASDIHGIKDEDVSNEPTFADKALELSKYFSDCDLAGYNIINFDLPLLAEEFLRADFSIPFLEDMKVIDPLKIFYKKEKRDLTSAYKFYCGKELYNAHSAEVDILATVEVLHNQIIKYELSSSINSLHNLCNDDGQIVDYDGKFIEDKDLGIVFAFGQNKGKSVLDHIDYLEWMLRQNFANHTKYIIRKIISSYRDDLPF